MKTYKLGRSRTMIKRAAYTVLLVALLIVGGGTGNAQTAPSGQSMQEARIQLSCQDPGSSQVIAKKPVITNTTDKPLAKDQQIVWSASDGDRGQITLDKDLATGEQVHGSGTPGTGYSCEAYTQG